MKLRTLVLFGASALVAASVASAAPASALYRRTGESSCVNVSTGVVNPNDFASVNQSAGIFSMRGFSEEGVLSCGFVADDRFDSTQVNHLWVDWNIQQVTNVSQYLGYNSGLSEACAENVTGGICACDSFVTVGGTVGWHNADLPHTSWKNNPGWYAFTMHFIDTAPSSVTPFPQVSFQGMFATD